MTTKSNKTERPTLDQVKLDRLRLLESVFINMNDAVLITEPEPVDEPGPRILYANRAFTEMTGYTEAEVLGQTPRILQGPHTSREALDQIRRALENWQTVQVELINYRKDGSEFWVELEISPVADEEGQYTYWVAIQRDITQRKRVELGLHQTNLDLIYRVEELTTLNLIAQTVATIADLQTILDTVAGTVTLLLNARSTAIRLLNPERTDLTLVALYDRLDYRASLSALMKRNAENRSNFIGHVLTLANTPIFKQVVETDQPVQITDLQNFSDLVVLHKFMQQYGLHHMLSVPLVIRGQVIGLINIITDDPARNFTPSEIDLAETIAGQIAGAIETSRLFEEERRHRQLAEAQNQELDAFARTVAHDLRNPLGLVISYADYISEYADQVPLSEIIEMVAKIKESGERTLRITDELLILAGVRRQEVELEPVDMAIVVTETLEWLLPMLKAYGAEVIQPASWPLAWGYGPWLEEVWTNYISNGLKYGGRPPRLELGATPQADQKIRFWVRDNGAGLTLEEQQRLFTEFTRLSEVKVEGYGLGLSIVRRIIEKLGGQVGVESQPGQGSEFYFVLPGVEET